MSRRALLLLLFSAFVCCAPAAGTTWYLRADGGDPTQCTGKTDAPFPGGTGGPYDCGLGDWRHFYDNRTYGKLNWIIHGGDTIIVDNTKYWRVGWDNGGINSGSYQFWCFGWGGSLYGCYNPPIPSGTAAQPTRILGRNWANCSIGEGVFKVPDPAKVSTLVGGLAVGCALSLSNTDYVDVQCLELTRQSNCCNMGHHQIPNFAEIPLSTTGQIMAFVHLPALATLT